MRTLGSLFEALVGGIACAMKGIMKTTNEMDAKNEAYWNLCAARRDLAGYIAVCVDSEIAPEMEEMKAFVARVHACEDAFRFEVSR